MIWQAIVDGFLSGAIVALGAIGVTFSLAILRFANFSHGDLLAVGAYSALFLLAIMIGEGGGGPVDSPWPWLVQPVGPFSFGWGLPIALQFAVAVSHTPFVPPVQVFSAPNASTERSTAVSVVLFASV